MSVLQVWNHLPWLWHGFSTRQGGISTVYGHPDDLNLGWTKEDFPENTAQNRRIFVEKVTQSNSLTAVTVRQVHGIGIQRVTAGMAPLWTTEGKAVLEGDGLVTNEPWILIGIQTADCIPVVVVDPVQRAVGVFHAGWRGTVQGMAQAGVRRMVSEFGSKPEDLLAAVGPGIGPCCFEVGDEVREEFRQHWTYAEDLFAGRNVDLWEANRRQLIDAGLKPANVTVLGECTGHQLDKYFSHRKEKGMTGRMMAVAGIQGTVANEE